jgi:S-DNA-T family DNA segregation ATPase FtsK/SpoIIIE
VRVRRPTMARSRPKRSAKKSSAEPSSWFGRLARRIGSTLSSLALGREVDEHTGGVLQEIKGLLFVFFSLWLGIAVASFWAPLGDATGVNFGGALGFYLARQALVAIGWSAYLFCFLGLAWGVVLMSGRQIVFPWVRVLGGACLLFSAAVLFELAFGADYASHTLAQQQLGFATGDRLPYGPGGWLAQQLVQGQSAHGGATGILVENFGLLGAWLLTILVTAASFMLATELAFVPAIAAFVHWLSERRTKRGEPPLRALGVWLSATLASWWDFLRGADIEIEPLPKKRSTKKLAKKKASKKKAAAADDEADEADDDVDAEAEADEQDAWDDASDDDVDADEEAVDDDEIVPAPKKRATKKKAAAAAAAAAEEASDDEDSAANDEDDWGGDDADDVDASDTDEWNDDEEDADEADADEDWEEAAPAAARGSNVELVKKKLSYKAPEPRPYAPPTPPKGPWKFPPLELLIPPDESRHTTRSAEDIEAEARRLEAQLASFRVEAQVVGSIVGPVVTLYELEVAEGTRLNKVTQLSNEIAAALRAKSIRVIAPIPGRSTVGVEVPNSKRRVVRFSELITKEAYDSKHFALPLFLGMDAEGNPVVEDLARMPHVLIAGQTGSGKSVCINTIIASLLLTRSPHDVQLIMIDPKMVELQMYSEVPHQMCPVVTDMKYATNVLEWACEKMEMRYELFKHAGVRNIKGYNALGEDKLKERMGQEWSEERTPRHVPYIVVVIDEMADLMMTSKKEAEGAITRLAQKSRAVGIHVIVATQRPSTDVITGVLKGNLPTRIAFTVASNQDSRVILDKSGAEKLLGQGDMLYTPPQSSQLVRAQGALVEDSELQALVDYVCKESAPNFNQELVQVATGMTRSEGAASSDPAAEDELWDQAVRAVLSTGRGSASLLQRHLKVGYTRASRLIDMMGEVGIVGNHKGSKSREVLLSLEEWEEMTGAATGGAPNDHE